MTRQSRRRRRLVWAVALAVGACLTGWWSVRHMWGVSIGTWGAFALTFFTLNRESTGLVVQRGSQRWRPLLLSATLVAGLWLTLPLVFSMADLGSGSSAPLRLALDPSGAATSVGSLVLRGLSATLAACGALLSVMLWLQPSRGTSHHRASDAESTPAREIPIVTPLRSTPVSVEATRGPRRTD